MSNSSKIFDSKIFCDLCSILTATSLDHKSKSETGVCKACNLKFIEPNREKWDAGWRPSKSEIKKFKNQIEKSTYSILNEINNYM